LRDGRCARDNAQERKPAAREVQTTDDCESDAAPDLGVAHDCARPVMRVRDWTLVLPAFADATGGLNLRG
jgi:hypothetical protein